jgi:glucosyl-dolichyl phosphate glucuronosyltransferase
MKALSIIICTYNRKEELKKVLLEIFKQFKEYALSSNDVKKVINDVELIIIDNNSSDETGSMVFNLISQEANGNLDLRYFIELEQGSSVARNRGINESKGNVLAFLDDDILLDPEWFSTCYEMVINKPKKIVRGARIIPLWSSELPEWLNLEAPFEIIQSCFPSHDYGSTEKNYPFYLDKETNEDEDFNFLGPLGNKLQSLESRFKRKISNPISACFLASKDVFEQVGNFRQDLGIQGATRGACEDTELFWRILANNIEIKYSPQLKVFHPIPPQRMTKKFVLDWYKLLGETITYIQSKNLDHLNNSKTSSKLSLYIKLNIFRAMFLLSFLLMDPIKSFWFKTQIAKAKGALNFYKKLVQIKHCNNFT